MDQQRRTAFGVLEGARSSYKPAIFMDSGCVVEGTLEMLLRVGSVAV